MNLHLTKKLGVLALQSVIAASLVVPAIAFAQTPTTTSATTTAVSGNSDNTFTALTQIPQIDNIASADNFSAFINTLYKICIGVGSVLAVLMIMYAGVLFMTSSGSVQGNEKAKKYISNAIFGLVLILTPTIVFGIINPSILNINIGSEFNKLQTQLQQVPIASTATSTASPQTCSTQYSSISAVNPGGSCSSITNGVSVDKACCSNLVQGGICCGVPKTTTTATPGTSQPAPQPATAATGYGWAIYMVPKGKTAPENLQSKGPFATSQECSVSLSNFYNENNVDQSGNKAPLCNCSSKISQQPGCPVR